MSDKKRYSNDKPVSCEYCYFWAGYKYGCDLESCHYLILEEISPLVEELLMCYQKGNCSTCPYGRASLHWRELKRKVYKI